MQSETSDQVQECSDSGNQFPFCYPLSTDVWTNGSTHNFIWNFNYPFYVGYEQISLYLYYIIKYEYVSVKNYTDLDRASGFVQVTVDDSWFLNPLPAGSSPTNLTIVAFYLPPTLSPYTEISSPISMFPRPFNFTVVQLAPPAVNTNNTNSTTNSNENNDNNMNNNNNNNSNNNNNNAYSSSSHLPGWAIAVIVIAVIAFICGVAALIWAVLISRRNKRNNKLIPIAGTTGTSGSKGGGYNGSINSQTKVTAFRSTDSVPMTTASAGENASSIGTLAYAGYDSSNKLSSTDAVLLADTFRNTLGRSVNDWNASLEDQEQEELKRRRLGEVLLQRQLEEDGTSVKHAGRFTRVKSLADIQKSAVFEHPKY